MSITDPLRPPEPVAGLLERLENSYDFQCEGGPLKNCVEWQQLCALLRAQPSPSLPTAISEPDYGVVYAERGRCPWHDTEFVGIIGQSGRYYCVLCAQERRTIQPAGAQPPPSICTCWIGRGVHGGWEPDRQQCAIHGDAAIGAQPSPSLPDPQIECPLCGVTVKQISSATLSLALWQHVQWVCEKRASGASPSLTLGELNRQAERYLERRGKGGNDHIRAYTYRDTIAAMASFADHVLAPWASPSPAAHQGVEHEEVDVQARGAETRDVRGDVSSGAACIASGNDDRDAQNGHVQTQEKAVAPSPVASPSQEYYGKAVDLVADELTKLTPDQLDARRMKLVAVLRNAAHYFAGTLTGDEANDHESTAVVSTLQSENRDTVGTGRAVSDDQLCGVRLRPSRSGRDFSAEDLKAYQVASPAASPWQPMVAEALRQLLRDYDASAEKEVESKGRYEWFWVDEIEDRIEALSGSKEWRKPLPPSGDST